MLALTHLHFDYYDKPLLCDVTFRIAKGELLHLRGPNGAGKTTLLRLIAGLFRPLSGEICFNESSIYNNLADYHRHICLIGHKTGANPLLTVQENLRFDVRFSPSDSLESLLTAFNLKEQAEQLAGTLSAGQKKRLSLVRLLMSNAPLWLLDEPFVALDEASVSLFLNALARHRERGGLVLMTSHQRIPPTLGAHQEYCL